MSQIGTMLSFRLRRFYVTFIPWATRASSVGLAVQRQLRIKIYIGINSSIVSQVLHPKHLSISHYSSQSKASNFIPTLTLWKSCFILNMLSFQESIAIAEIVVYIPILFLTLFVIFRHGFHRQLGWIYLGIFGAIRLASAAFKIEETQNPTNITDIEWASILTSIGLSPLLLASLGLLKRV